MKKGTKIIVFISAMGLTLGSLIAFVGPRHCGYGMRQHEACYGRPHNHAECGQSNQAGSADTNPK